MRSERVKIIQITDTHILSDPDEAFDGIDTAQTLSAVLAHIRANEQPDLMLLTGDLVHEPDQASYRRLHNLLDPVPAPVYAIPGNHDDPALMQSALDQPVRHDRDIDVSNWRILLLSSWLEGKHAGILPATELHWFEARLNEQPDTPTLVALHHPPVSIGSPWLDAMGLQNPDDFFAILDRQPQVAGVIWGHIHQVFESERNGVKLLSCPSTCVQFRPGSKEYAKDELGPGYRRLILHENGTIDSEVIRV